MKKLLTFLTMALLFYGVGWAETKTATLTMSESQTSPVTDNEVVFTWTSSNIVTGGGTGGKSSGFKANSNMTVTLPSGATLTSISKTNGNNWGNGATIKVYQGSDNTGANIASIVMGTNSYNISSNNTGGIFYFENTTTKNAWIQTLTITYETSGGSSSGTTYSLVTSELQIAAGNKYILADANGKVLEAINSSHVGTTVDGTISGSNITVEDAMELTLEKYSDSWVFKTASGKYVSAESSGIFDNNTNAFNGAMQTLSVDATGVATLKFAGGYYITFNGTNFIAKTSQSNSVYLYGAADNVTLERPATPIFSPSGGEVVSGTEVTISCTTDGVEIAYSTNGGANWTGYTTPIAITEATTLQAKAIKDGISSEVATATYTIFTPATVTPTYEVPFTSGFGDFYKQDVTNPTTSDVWTSSSTYGAVASGRFSSTNYATESLLISPFIDLTNTTNPKLSFSHAGNYFTSTSLMQEDVQVLIKKQSDSSWSTLTVDTWPTGTGWTFVDNTTSLSSYAGEVIQIAFKYTSTKSRAGTWEIKNFKVEDLGAYNIYRTIKTNGNSDNEAGGWIGDWSSNCSTPDGVSGNHYTVTATAGETVQFKVGTNNGYQILQQNVTAVDGSGNNITLNKVSSDNSGIVFSFTMPVNTVTITADFNTYHGTLRLAGHFNGNSTWRSGNEGPEFTYDSANDKYTIRAYFTGVDDGGANDYFCLTLDGEEKHPQADQGNYYIYDLNGGAMPFNLSGGSNNNFGCAPGVYDIEINGSLTSMKFTKVDPTITITPAAGEVEQGTTVNATSTLTSMIAAIKANDSDAAGEVTVGVNTDNGSTWNENVALNTVGSTTVYGKAYIGNIAVTGSAAYTVYTAYAITCSATPDNYGTVTADKQTAREGETVTLTVTPSNNNYEVISVTVNGTTLEPNDGVYSFEMPASAVEVIATFNKIQYTITKAETNCTINITDNLTTAGAGDPVSFTVTPRGSKYVISSVTISWEGGGTQALEAENGVYSFTMQGRNVTINAVCEREAVGDGTFVLVTDASQLKAGDKVIITNSKAAGSALAMSTTQNNNNRGSTGVTITSDIKITPSSDVQILTLESTTATVNSNSVDAWLLKAGSSGYLYAASSGSNHLKTSPNVTDNSKATIGVESQGNAAITFRGSCTRNIIRNNGSIFSCYASGQSPVYLFKQSAAGLMVEINPEGGDVIGAQEVTIDANIEGAMVQYKIGDGEWSTAAEAPVTTTITGNVGDDVVVYAKASLVDDDETLEDDISATYHFIAPNAPVITPSSKSVMDVKQSVTITTEYADGQVEYSTDGGETWTTYNGVFDVFINALGESATVTARVTVNGVTSETTSATYTRNIQPVVFSPVSGTYYYGEQSVEMFSVTPGARIYYTMTTDGTEPADPVMNGTGVQLYSGPIEGLEAGTTYKFKAVAYIGTTASEVSSAEYTIEAHSDSYWQNVAAMNADDGSVTKYFENPVQVVYMSTYQNNGRTPEFCYVRDNSGYGLVYFAKNHTAYNGYTKFQMGDWLDGKTIRGTTDTWDRGFHNELGTSSGSIYKWPSNNVGNTTILPEAVTNADVKAGWNASNYNSSGGYKTGVTDDNLWGHYIHLRNNTVSGLSTVDDKYKGVMTDQNNEKLTYYDVFYKFSGFGTNAKTYNQSFFDARQVKGATFDFYGIVAFYGPDANDATYANQPFQIVPLDILWVYKPQISGVQEGETYVEPQEVTLSIDAVEGDDEHSSVIWYKTSEMDDYAIYTGPFTVSTTTTIEAYTTKMTEYSDRMESVHVTTNVNFTHISTPFIKPDGGVYAVTDDPVDVTITRNPELDDASVVQSDVNIWFTVDGSDPADENNPNRYEYTTENKEEHLDEIHTTTTVRAISEYLGVYSEEAISQTYTFVESNGIIYNLVTNVNQINENGVYVIVNQPGHEAMSNVQGATTRGTTGVKFVDEDMKTKVYGNQDVAVFTVTPLTHEGDTGGEKHFLFTTHNGATLASNGILYVDETAAANGNTLLTEAEEDAMGNSVAVVTIDNDEGEQSHKARIRFNYAGGDNRYLQYWNRDHYFTTYKTQDDERAVYLYYKEATPLATIEKEGVKNTQYTVADRLLVVAANNKEHVIWAKDEGNVSIARTEIKNGQIDYMRYVAENDISSAQDAGVLFQDGDWDQSNWVMIKLLESDENYNSPSKYEGSYILPASLTGRYTDDLNYTIEAMSSLKDIVDATGGDFTPNVYCAANFLDANLNLTAESQGAPELPDGDRHFFFVNPKVQEVATITYAVWDGTKFVMPARNDAGTINGAGLTGAFEVGWKYNGSTPTLETGVAYQFTAVLNKVAQQGNAPRRAESTVTPQQQAADGTKMVYPLDLTADESHIVTEVRDLNGNAVREVVSVKYVSITGVVSDKPFEGMNIIVTRYTDGTTSTAKVMR